MRKASFLWSSSNWGGLPLGKVEKEGKFGNEWLTSSDSALSSFLVNLCCDFLPFFLFGSKGEWLLEMRLIGPFGTGFALRGVFGLLHLELRSFYFRHILFFWGNEYRLKYLSSVLNFSMLNFCFFGGRVSSFVEYRQKWRIG